MSDFAAIPPSEANADCAADEALKSSAHSRAIWFTKSDGTKINVADVLCCIAEAAEPTPPKPLVIPMIRQPDCVPVLVSIPCDGAGGYDFDNPTEIPAMANFEPAVPTEDSNTFAEAQVTSFKLRDAFSGTAEDVLAAALETPVTITNPVDPTLEPTPVTADMICDFDYVALPCDSVCLKDPLDPESGIPVTVDGTFVNATQVRSGGDPEKGGADLTAPVAQVDGAVSAWCFTFRAEFDKAGELVAA